MRIKKQTLDCEREWGNPGKGKKSDGERKDRNRERWMGWLFSVYDKHLENIFKTFDFLN